jgi:hypothetical protein
MIDDSHGLLLPILRDIQVKLGRLESRMANIEMRMGSLDAHSGLAPPDVPSSTVGADRISDLLRRVKRIERTLERVYPA